MQREQQLLLIALHRARRVKSPIGDAHIPHGHAPIYAPVHLAAGCGLWRPLFGWDLACCKVSKRVLVAGRMCWCWCRRCCCSSFNLNFMHCMHKFMAGGPAFKWRRQWQRQHDRHMSIMARLALVAAWRRHSGVASWPSGSRHLNVLVVGRPAATDTESQRPTKSALLCSRMAAYLGHGAAFSRS